jgi:Domain of unknown function (DUF5078)
MHSLTRRRQRGAHSAVRAGIAVLIGAFAIAALPGTATADSTEDYPIPARILHTTCTAEQLLAAARDYEPIYFERYMIDMHNKPEDIQQSTKDKIHWFLSMDYAGRRGYSDSMFNNGVDPLWLAWPNHMKIFFNNKGVAAKETDHCADYPPDDLSVWDWTPAR